jgi:hypothetical protein
MVPVGFAERVLTRCAEVEDPALLWDTATTCAALAQKWNGHGKEKNEIKAAQMFVEIELGQRLGPNPGDDGKGPGKSAYAHFSMPKELVRDIRRFYGYRDFLIALVCTRTAVSMSCAGRSTAPPPATAKPNSAAHKRSRMNE